MHVQGGPKKFGTFLYSL